MRVDMTGGAGCPRQVGEAFGRPAGLWCAGGAGVPGGRATTSRRAGCRRLPPDDADWSFSSGLSSVPRTEPCGYRRVTAALRPRGRGCVGREAVRTRPCVPRARQAAAPPRGTRRHRPRAAGPGVSRPDLVKRGSRRRPAGSEVGGRHPPVSEPGEGPDLPGDRCRAAVPGRWSGTPLGRPHAAPAPGVRGDRHGGPQVPDEEGEDDPPRPRPRHPGTPPPSSPGT